MRREVAKQEPIDEFEAWMIRHGLSAYEVARRLGIPYSTVKRVLAGKTSNVCTLAKFFYASDGQLSLEQMLPRTVRAEMKQRYRGLLLRRTAARKSTRPGPRRSRSARASAP